MENGCFFTRSRIPTAAQSRNAARSHATTVAPTGVEKRYEPVRPRQKQTTASTPAKITTERNRLNTRMAESAGKMTSDEMSSAPIMRMPSTTVSAVSIESSVL